MIYVGLKTNGMEVFRSAEPPTTKTHGAYYWGVIGEFKTLRGAEFFAKHAFVNPFCHNVETAEQLAVTSGVL